jgi:uncharacterized protein YdhG (YjbR/CyaY superfamily)
MAKTDHRSVDDYIAVQPAATQKVLRRVREVIRRSLPGADEVVSYQIPTYKLDGRTVIFFAGWKEHFSIYPATEEVVAALGDALAPYEVQRGTIRFPIEGRIPVHLIGRIARLRAQEAARSREIRPTGERRSTARAAAKPVKRKAGAKSRGAAAPRRGAKSPRAKGTRRSG